MSSTNISPDFGLAATDLAANIEQTMASLYNLQMSLINAQGSGLQALPTTFVDVRKTLKISWEPILALLQKSHAFGSDVVLLKDSLQTESVEDCVEFLMEMSVTAGNLCELSKARVTENEDAVRGFCAQMPTMLQVLEASLARSKLIRSREEDLHMLGDSHYSLHDQTHISQSNKPPIWVEPTSADEKTIAFVEANLAIVRPDGTKALHATRDSMAEIAYVLRTIHKFWQFTSTKCEDYITESLTGTPNLTMEQAAQFAAAWKGYQAALKEALTSVARSCDAILVDAVGAGPRTPTSYSPRGYFSQQHRQGDEYVILEKPHPLPSGSNTRQKGTRVDILGGRGSPGGYGQDDSEKKLWALYK